MPGQIRRDRERQSRAMKASDQSPWSEQTLRAFQGLSEQNMRALRQSLRGLNPTLADQIRTITGSYRTAEQVRKLVQRPKTQRIFADVLAQTKFVPSSQILKAASGVTLSDSLRETVATIAGQSSLKAKLAATSILGEQATFARIQIPERRLLNVAGASSWQGLSRSFAQQAAEALSVAGLNAELELQRIRGAAREEREAAREAWDAAAAQAASAAEAAPDAGLEDVPALIGELIAEIKSLASAMRASTKAARSKINTERAALLVMLITLVYMVLADHVEPFMRKSAPAPQAQPKKPRLKAKQATKKSKTTGKPGGKTKQGRGKR
jgi:hypothetical protein